MFKNIADQYVAFYAWDTANNVPKTGDAANISTFVSLDGAAESSTTASVSELDATNCPGVYVLAVTQGETNGGLCVYTAISSSSDIYIAPQIVYTNNLSTVAGNQSVIEGKVDTIDGNVDSILEDTGTTIPSQITGLNDLSAAEVNAEVDASIEDYKLDHLVAVAESDDPADDSIIAKLATKNGDWSDFASAQDSLEAVRDRGDSAWLTGAGSVGAKVYTTTDWTRTAGDNDGGTVNDVEDYDGTTFDTGEVVGSPYLQVDAVFPVDAGDVPDSLDVWGGYDGGSSHYMQVLAKDGDNANYELIGTMANEGGVIDLHTFPLFSNHIDSSNDINIRFLHAGGNGNATHVFQLDKVQVTTHVATSSADAVADAVWDEAVAEHVVVGSFGESVSDIEAKIDIIDTNVDDIETDTGTTLPALISSVTGGTGSVEVDQDYGSTDALAAVDAGGSYIDGVEIKAYITVEYEAGTFTVRGQTLTNSDGSWDVPLMLDPGTYTLVYIKDGKQTTTQSLVVT